MNKLHFLIVPMALSALVTIAGCSTAPSAAELPLCGPRPTLMQARMAAQYWAGSTGRNPSATQISGVHIGKPGKLYRGLINGGGYDYGWWIVFASNLQNGFGGYTGFCRTTILLNVNTGAHWNGAARDCW